LSGGDAVKALRWTLFLLLAISCADTPAPPSRFAAFQEAVIAPDPLPHVIFIRIHAPQAAEWCVQAEGAPAVCVDLEKDEIRMLYARSPLPDPDWHAWSSAGEWESKKTHTVTVQGDRRRVIRRPE
jgi:hypothetical protein